MSLPIPEEVSGVHREPANAAAHRRYAAVTWSLAALLLLMAPWQLQWQSGKSWAQQPGLFAMVGVVGMLVFGAFEWAQLRRQTAHAAQAHPGPELKLWARGLEFALWFMVYVWGVPHVGYLPMTLLFALGLSQRLGYRSGRLRGVAIGVAVATVLIFKGALSVKVPAAAWYELLPEPLASFFIMNL